MKANVISGAIIENTHSRGYIFISCQESEKRFILNVKPKQS